MVKKLLAISLAICMVAGISVISVFAMDPYEITYNIHSEGENNVMVETGDVITVTFEMIRTDSDAETYFLNSYQNEIEYDMDFFELDEESIQMTYPVESGVDVAPIRTTGQQIIKATNTQVTHDKSHVVCTFNLKVVGTYGSGTVRTSKGKCSGWDDSENKSIKNTITTCDLTVTIDPSSIVNVESVELVPETATLTAIVETLTLATMITPYNASNKNVTYESSDEGVVTVSNAGVVTAVSDGTAVITVTTEDGNKTATATITVEAYYGEGTVSLVVNPIEDNESTKDVTITVTRVGVGNATPKAVEFTETDSGVIKINKLSLANGTYKMSVKKQKYLEAVITFTVTQDEHLNLGKFDLLAGDIIGEGSTNGDGLIDIDDFVIAIQAFDSGATKIKVAADIDGDCENTVSDLMYIKTNFNKTTEDDCTVKLPKSSK